MNWMDRAMFVSNTLILYSWFTYLDDYFHLCSPYLFLHLLKTADTVLVSEPVDSRTQSPVDLGSRGTEGEGTVTLQRTPTRQNEKEKNIVREFTAVSPTLVCYTAVFSVVTQRSSPRSVA